MSRAACWRRPGCGCPTRPWPCCMSGPKAGRPGSRLAALSLAGHPDPELFAAGFSGSERTVAEYLLAEVLGRQPKQVRRLLVRTSVLGARERRARGPAHRKIRAAGGSCGSWNRRTRSWSRWTRSGPGSVTIPCLPTCLQLELLDTAQQEELARLHGAAAGWFAEHGFAVEAVRHAQAAQDWDLAARLLFDHWFGLVLDGQAATADELLAGFPVGLLAADAELTALLAARELNRGSFADAERHLQLAAERSASVPAEPARAPAGRAGHAAAHRWLSCAATSRPRSRKRDGWSSRPRPWPRRRWGWATSCARWRCSGSEPPSSGRDASRKQSGISNTPGRWRSRSGGRTWSSPASSTGRGPSWDGRSRSVLEPSRQAIELARRHGWTDDPLTGDAYLALGAALVWRGRLEEAEPWIQRAERAVREEAEPAAALGLHYVRAQFELARGREKDALAAFRAAERQAERLVAPHPLAAQLRASLLRTLIRIGATRAGRASPRRTRREGAGDRGDAHRRGRAAARPATIRWPRPPPSSPSSTAPSR